MESKNDPISHGMSPPPYETSQPQPQYTQPIGFQAVNPTGPPVPSVIVLGPEPQRLTCPFCHQNIQTCVKKEPSTKTHLIALLLCVVGCWCCVCIPYCTDSCLSAQHTCSNCGAFIGDYSN